MDGIGSSSTRLSFGGLASGIDTAGIVEALMEAERQPLLQIQSQRAEVEQRQSLFQELNRLFLGLRDAAESIDNRSDTLAASSATEEFLAYQADSSDDSVATATASGSASPGSYEVEVTALARAGRRVSQAYASADTAVSAGAGTLTVAFGGDADIEVAVDGTTTLQQVADAINDDESNDGSVRADVLFDGSEYRLVVSGRRTGAAHDVVVSSDFGAFVDETLTQNATDAELVVLGVPITRESNEIGDALPGVTLTLTGTTEPGESVSISVSRDDEEITEGVQGLVDAYNALRDFTLAQSAVNPDTNRAGPLSGNVTVRSLERRAQQVLGNLYSFAGNPFSSLSSIGLRFDDAGRLALDSEKLEEALDTDPIAVRELLSGDGTTDGVATALARDLEPVVRPSDGLLALQEDGLERQIRDLDTRIERFELRLEQREESLVLRFAQLESVISNLQAQSGFLTSLGGTSG
ncbi:MAG: flagellar filament capping protein FliD [Myxococcota bacterium]